jgi:hypothetical protein
MARFPMAEVKDGIQILQGAVDIDSQEALPCPRSNDCLRLHIRVE